MANFNVADAKRAPQIVIRDAKGDISSVITPKDFQVGFEGNPGALILKGALDINASIVNVKTLNDASFSLSSDKIAYFVVNTSGLPVYVRLPRPTNIGQLFIVKDFAGTATSLIPIIVNASDGSLIDGQLTQSIISANNAFMLVWTGTSWASMLFGSPGVGGAPGSSKYVVWGDESVSLPNSRIALGTANEITVTNDGTNVNLGLASIVSAGTTAYPSSITIDAKGRITSISAGTASGPANASYVTLGSNATLTDERILTAGTGINIADAGANSNVTVSVDDDIVATVSGSTFTGVVKFNSGLSGSLTQLTTGASYLAAGTSISITSASNGQITIASTAVAVQSTGTWRDPGNTFITTGSVSIDASNRAASAIGTDVFFFASGTTGITGSAKKVAVFGGDVQVSGVLILGTGSIQIHGNVSGTSTAATSSINFINSSYQTLASITDNVTGSIFSVADIVTGIPSIDIYDNKTIRLSGNLYFGSGTINPRHFLISGTKGIYGGTQEYIPVFDTDVRVSGTLMVGTGTPGTDVIFFVSGSTGLSSGANRKVAIFGGDTIFSGGLSGSLQRTTGGLSYLVAGTSIAITSASNGQITIATVGLGGSDTGASYVVLAATGALANERVLTAGAGISITDAGAGSTVTISTTTGSNRIDADASDIIVWKLNELVGNSLSNTGTSGSVGDLTGSAQLVYGRAGVYDTSIDFRGYNTATFASASATIQPKDYDINISSWIYPYQFMSGVVVIKNSTTSLYEPLSPLVLGITGAYGNPFVQIRTTNTAQNLLLIEASRSLNVYSWNHFGCSISGSGTSAVIRMYINGDFIKSMVISGSIDYVSGGWWAVGGIPTPGSEAGDYKLNDIRIADTVRDAAWWREIYIRGLRGSSGVSGAIGATGPAGSAASITGTWRDASNAFATTGSVSIDTSNRIASQIGTDVFFFVSGSSGVTSGPNRKVSIFGGETIFSGTSIHSGGLSGSLQRTTEGLSYLVAGTSITVTSASNGQITIASTGAATQSTGTFRDAGNAFITTGSVSVDVSNREASTIGTDVFFFVSGSTGLSSGANRKVAIFGGDVIHSGGLSGSLQQTSGGLSYLVAGASVTITSASNGQITIASTAAATAATGTWRDATNTFITTGSVSIDGQNRAVSSIGSDVFLFVSGNTGLSGTAAGKITAFGGDVKITGTLSVGTGSLYLDSNEVRWNTNTKIFKDGSDLKFYDVNNTAGWTLSQLASSGTAGSGGGDPGASYVVIGSTASLSNERVLTAGTGISIVDGGANGAVTISATTAGASTVSSSVDLSTMQFIVPIMTASMTSSFFKKEGALPVNLVYSAYPTIKIGDYVYTYGGYGTSGSISLTSAFRAPVSDPLTWTQFASALPFALDRAAVVVVKDKIYILGAKASRLGILSASVSDPLTWYDTGRTVTASLDPGFAGMPPVFVIGNYIYVYGGYGVGSVPSSRIHRTSINDPGAVWEYLGDMPAARVYPGGYLVNDHVYIVGGYNVSFAAQTTIFKAHIDTPWVTSQVADVLPFANTGIQSSIIGNDIFLYGGDQAAGIKIVLRAPVATPTTFTSLGTVLAQDISFGASIIANGKFYYVGGTNAGQTVFYANGFRSNLALTCSTIGLSTVYGADSGSAQPLGGISPTGQYVPFTKNHRLGYNDWVTDFTASYASSSQVTTAAAAVTGTWRDAANTFITTGSVSIDSQNRAVSSIGSDVFLFVSGNMGLSGTSSGKVAAFGGDVKITGTLAIGTGSIYIDSNEVRWNSSTKIYNSASNLVFKDAFTTSSLTLSQIVAGWETLVELDFTAQGTQNLLTGGDGQKTIGGVSIGLAGSANCSAIDLGASGIVLTRNANTAASVIFTFDAVTNAAFSEFKMGEVWEFTVAADTAGMAVTNEGIYTYWLDGAIARALSGILYTAGARNSWYSYNDPPGNSIQHTFTTTNGTDDVFQILALNATQVEVYSGVYSATWNKTLRKRGHRNHTVQTSHWIATGNAHALAISADTGSTSCNGRVTTIKYVRIRRKAV